MVAAAEAARLAVEGGIVQSTAQRACSSEIPLPNVLSNNFGYCLLGSKQNFDIGEASFAGTVYFVPRELVNVVDKGVLNFTLVIIPEDNAFIRKRLVQKSTHQDTVQLQEREFWVSATDALYTSFSESSRRDASRNVRMWWKA